MFNVFANILCQPKIPQRFVPESGIRFSICPEDLWDMRAFTKTLLPLFAVPTLAGWLGYQTISVSTVF